VTDIINTPTGSRVMTISGDDPDSGEADLLKLTLDLDDGASDGMCSGCFMDLHAIEVASQMIADDDPDAVVSSEDDSDRRLQDTCGRETNLPDRKLNVMSALCIWAKCSEFQGDTELISANFLNFQNMLLTKVFHGGNNKDVTYDSGANLNERTKLRLHRQRGVITTKIWWALFAPKAGFARCKKVFCLKAPFTMDAFAKTFHNMWCTNIGR